METLLHTQSLRLLGAVLGVERVLVGYPLDLQGEEGPAARRAVRFAELWTGPDQVALLGEMHADHANLRAALHALRDAVPAPAIQIETLRHQAGVVQNRSSLLASLNGYAPALAVEFGRKVLYSTERPSFAELEEHIKKKK